MKDFLKTYYLEIDKLKMFIPIVNKVHGKAHKEFSDVLKLFNEIVFKVENNNFNLENEFNNLKRVTNNYKIPKDTCETYEYVYKRLKLLNESYGD